MCLIGATRKSRNTAYLLCSRSRSFVGESVVTMLDNIVARPSLRSYPRNTWPGTTCLAAISGKGQGTTELFDEVSKEALEPRVCERPLATYFRSMLLGCNSTDRLSWQRAPASGRSSQPRSLGAA